MSVVRLAVSNDRLPRKACSDCRFYQPKLDPAWGYGKRLWSLSPWPPFIRSRVVPNSMSHMDAVCTAYGGEAARSERKSCGRCKPEGLMFDPSALPCNAGETDRG